MNILLDYVFPITAIEPTAAASTAFLKQVLVVVKPASGATEDTITLCTSMAEVAELTDNTEAQQLFNAGMNRVFVIAVDDLDMATLLVGHESDFFTILISSDFSDNEIELNKAVGAVTITSYANLVSGTDDSVDIYDTSFIAQSGAVTLGDGTFQAATSAAATAASLMAQINGHPSVSTKVIASIVEDAPTVVILTAKNYGAIANAIAIAYTDNDTNIGATVSGATLTGGSGLTLGAYTGVVGIASADDTYNAARAATTNYCAFHTTSGNKALNMFYAFGKLLSNSLNWKNQQFITMPFADDVNTLGGANALFDDKVSFVLDDTEYGKRLGLFAQGAKAIVKPYIIKNLEVDMQSSALSYISGNQPAYTKVQAALLEDELQKVVQSYIDRQWIEVGTVGVSLVESNFVASGSINVAEPGALWRIFGELSQTL